MRRRKGDRRGARGGSGAGGDTMNTTIEGARTPVAKGPQYRETEEIESRMLLVPSVWIAIAAADAAAEMQKRPAAPAALRRGAAAVEEPVGA